MLYPIVKKLLTGQLLITEEDGSIVPVVPSVNQADWRYYGAISSVPNPHDTMHHFSVLDHLRHLLALDPNLRAVGLAGGLQALLYRNSLQVQRLAASAQVASSSGDEVQVYQQTVRLLAYLDGTTQVQGDLPAGTPLFVDPNTIRIGLLGSNSAHDRADGLIDQTMGELAALADSPGLTQSQHTLALQLEAELGLVKQMLEQARLDAKQLITRPLDQWLSPPSQMLLADLVKQVNLAVTGQGAPVMATSKGGVAWVSTHTQSLAEILVMPYSAP